MELIKFPPKEDWNKLLERPVMNFEEIEDRVKPILTRVAEEGDKALKAFTATYDKVEIEELLVSKYEIKEAEKKVDKDLQTAIKIAKSNIEKFHVVQKELVRKVETMPGVTCWRKSIPIDKVGLYIPGGTAPLFSTVLMLGIPAVLAGCKEVILCTPPDKNGEIHPAILYTASLIGIDKIFKVGGAQGVAAMAFGTESVPKVNKIFGPGNQYVTAAKQLVTKTGVAIDMPAGPSEVAVIADASANPDFIASDLLSQAEHGVDSQVLLVTNDKKLPKKVVKSLNEQLEDLPRKEFAIKALENSKTILMKDMEGILELINQYAPEHLIISTENAEELGEQITNAGSVFLGHLTPESVGDYASGTNHTLPTNGYANVYSGVSLDSFFKKVTFQKITEKGLENIGKAVELMAEAESLHAHKNAVTLRLKKIKEDKIKDKI
ncbi:histidinol dehydrogenase [Flexithrix dorotheae]|uniref:histidinol dehydrogenase n=1 Tax=Flexithrix dorotheae TaxID=70993 RepID=UPI0004761A28|nr:histidinol dehydrogenase [Flexithrix dorotheae]